eukprot:GHRQ01037004.1.p1 GENE.GHRQ01037004.1~~GHRQ01037004.1.p1  ORF type:complete len:131 (+),score=11.79 GHRQ01037004.1:129-521(+)
MRYCHADNSGSWQGATRLPWQHCPAVQHAPYAPATLRSCVLRPRNANNAAHLHTSTQSTTLATLRSLVVRFTLADGTAQCKCTQQEVHCIQPQQGLTCHRNTKTVGSRMLRCRTAPHSDRPCATTFSPSS